MTAKGLTVQQVEQAMARANTRFAGNLIFNRKPEKYRGRVRFTIRVNDCRGPGHRRRTTPAYRFPLKPPPRMACACYHAYGEVIRELFASGATLVETAATGRANWREGGKGQAYRPDTFIYHAHRVGHLNIGSVARPCSFAAACDCGTGLLTANPPAQYRGPKIT